MSHERNKAAIIIIHIALQSGGRYVRLGSDPISWRKRSAGNGEQKQGRRNYRLDPHHRKKEWEKQYNSDSGKRISQEEFNQQTNRGTSEYDYDILLWPMGEMKPVGEALR
ncbi:hypothetical protein M413DRAFT_12714 [Hebeloma cylindrosporum]|uniref:Uncharacterized protein n=1 Tax=Hebeloma cylindrosporum TaxID=76867 RepID=A0A0C3C4G8_HEBCY|nr:hypothetical protein M413DRAFT_12714 [Hebeloma cylindrosporum h7]